MEIRVPYHLFRALAKEFLMRLDEEFEDPFTSITPEKWTAYRQMAKEIREVMEEEGARATLLMEEAGAGHEVRWQWQEVRDKANELEHDIGEHLRELEEMLNGYEEF